MNERMNDPVSGQDASRSQVKNWRLSYRLLILFYFIKAPLCVLLFLPVTLRVNSSMTENL